MRLGITGHRGLPRESERLIRTALNFTVQQYSPETLMGISCIADGPDAWFAESVLDHGGHIEVVVPASGYRDGLPAWHHATYDRLLRQAREVHSTGLSASDAHAHMAGSEILVGLADRLVAVWDGKPARGHGGTADVVEYANRNGVPVDVVWPDGAARDG
ncbi:hypothetical protein [Streptomyces nanshensis]|uniref:DNA recombination-mediator protein A n=1 Tax=Streptomyces nanshensis TaxID=518642 RepID=A0A1E7L2A1_9ACTN|nr:hypothetical protein [Streptomyces nanshensis]OEV10309.1 hypothetical protein AN218_18130 [Streptomyces nanshensis]